MPDQADHFRELLIDHGQHPRGEGLLAQASVTAEGANPETGDEVTIAIQIEDGVVAAIGFTANGSAVLRASCSMMVECLTGQSAGEAHRLACRFVTLLTEEGGDEDWTGLGDAEALRGIRRFPARVRCAILPWRTFAGAGLGDPGS